jgi:membrane protein implicated in regulation of membrane protease activity
MTLMIFVGIALGGFILVAGGFLFGHDHDLSHDVGHDFGHDVHPESEGTISIFSTKVLGTFVMGFGAAGAIAMHYEASAMNASLVGVGTGAVLAALMYVILLMFVKEQASSVIPAESVLGCIGVVTTSIDKDAVGEVGVSAEGQYRNYSARATGSQGIEKGHRVRVVRMAGGDLIVEEVQS